MADPREDTLILEGLGGLYNGEVFVLAAGQSGTLGRSSLATFPVTLSRNYRRLAADPGLPSLLARIQSRHVRFVYVGEGRLIVENLAGEPVTVGWQPVEDRVEVDLGKGPVRVEFGYGEHIVARIPSSPDTFQELAAPRDENREIQGVFMALLGPEGRVSPPPREDLALLPSPPADPPPPTPAPSAQEGSRSGRGGKRRRRGPFRFFRSGPAWLLSVLFHAVVVLGLFAFVISRSPVPPARIVEVTIRAPETPVKPPRAPEEEQPAPSPDPESAQTPDLPPPPTVREDEHVPERPGAADPEGLSGEVSPGIEGFGTAGLIGVGPGAAGGPRRAGGGAGPEGRPHPSRSPAIAHGLEWLARRQLPDGSWAGIASIGLVPGGTHPAKREYRIALTGLAVLAFTGAGFTHREGRYREVVRKAVGYLRMRQRPDGAFLPDRPAPADRPMYGQGIATLALAEILRQSGSRTLKGTVEGGVRYIERAQTPYAGWRYDPGARDSDTSVTGWQVLALAAAGRSGVRLNPASFEGAREWFERMTDPATGRVGYNRRGLGSLSATATALACRLILGGSRSDPAVRGARRLLAANLPAWPESPSETTAGNPPDVTYWLFGALAAARHGGDLWTAWRRALRSVLVPRQASRGPDTGSWDPPGRWSRVGGRVFSTSAALVTLEIALDLPTAPR